MFSRAEGKLASNVVPLAKLKGAAGSSRIQSNGGKVYWDFFNGIFLSSTLNFFHLIFVYQFSKVTLFFLSWYLFNVYTILSSSNGYEFSLPSKNVYSSVWFFLCVYACASTYGGRLCVTVGVWRREKPHLLPAQPGRPAAWSRTTGCHRRRQWWMP